MNPETDDRRWQAVLARDAREDGAFVYAVRSTGIYCRPSCPSRRPRRQLVEFLPGPDEAERAGFRACRRCRPREVSDHAQWVAIVAAACRHLIERLPERTSLAALSDHLGYSASHLHRAFRRVTGTTPEQFADTRRLEALKARLRDGLGVTEALYEVGYGSASRLYERAPRLGMTPATYRRGGAGVVLRYTVVRSPLGQMLVAATERGLAALRFGESRTALEAELASEFPAATRTRDDQGLGPWAAQLVAMLAGTAAAPDLPLDLRATAFQARVWEALRRIPAGETRSYAELARAVGAPHATRAVGRACASNPVAVVIPCHRVVRSDGETGGYRWGEWRKRRLLERERAGSPPARPRAHGPLRRARLSGIARKAARLVDSGKK